MKELDEVKTIEMKTISISKDNQIGIGIDDSEEQTERNLKGVDNVNGDEKDENTDKVDVIPQGKDYIEDSVARGESQRFMQGHAVSKTSGLVLALAIGVHSFFEGVAFGLSHEIQVGAKLGAGILIHKGAACISLGGSFARTGYSFSMIALILTIFAFTAPTGIILGMILEKTSRIVDVVFLSLSGGTFVYVACSEIIVNEFSRGGYKGAKVLCVCLGIAVICMLWFLEGPHNHEVGCKIDKDTLVDPLADPHAGHNH